MRLKIKLPDVARILGFIAPAVGAIPTVGPPLTAVIGVVVQLCTLVEGIKANREALESLIQDEALLAAAIAKAVQDRNGLAPQGLLPAISELSAILQETERCALKLANHYQPSGVECGPARKLLQKGRVGIYGAFHARDHAQELQQLELRVAKAVRMFGVEADIEQLRSLQDLMTMALSGWLRAELKPVHEARFDSANAATACLDGTRVDTLKGIRAWALSANAPQVLWLSGLAGTGKSAIAKSACKLLLEEDLLFASFFVSRNSVDQSSPEKLLHTLVYHCARMFPECFAHLHKTLVEAPETKVLPISIQVDKLFLDPLQQAAGRTPLLARVVVIDAFDECAWRDNCEGGRLLPSLLHAIHESRFPLRLLVTSRGEKTIADIFARHHEHLPIRLHDIERAITEKDIKVYLSHELGKIARAHGITEPWPSPAQMDLLVEKAGDLFVYAATLVRFLGNMLFDPIVRLEAVLHSHPVSPASDSPFSLLDVLYRDILAHAMRNEEGRDAEAFLRLVVGTIVLLQDPLSVPALSRLLSTYLPGTQHMVDRLAAVFLRGEAGLVRPYHPSFPEFYTTRCHDDRFRIVSADQHGNIALRCLVIMDRGLRQNICGIGDPSLANKGVPRLCETVNERIGEELRYACKHWLTHLSKSSAPTTDLLERLLAFLENHVFHWMETLSLMDALRMVLAAIPGAQTWLSKHNEGGRTTELKMLLGDAERTIQTHFDLISTSALQLYCSVVPFIPDCSLSRKSVRRLRRKINLISARPHGWYPLVSELKGAEGAVMSTAFMPDGVHLLSGSADGALRIWNYRTLECIATCTRDGQECINAVACSPDGSLVASGGEPGGVALWNVRTGALLRVLEGQSAGQNSVAFSQDGSYIAAASEDKTVRVWDVRSGETLVSMEGHTDAVKAVAFSPDGRRIASGSHDTAVRIWNAATGDMILELQAHKDSVRAVAFSPDGSRVLSGSWDRTIKLWDAQTGRLIHTLYGHTSFVTSVAFASHGSLIYSGAYDRTLRKWDAATGACISTLPNPHGRIYSIALLPNDSQIAAATASGVIGVWDSNIFQETAELDGHTKAITSLAFAPDGMTFASSSEDQTVRLWETRTGICLRTMPLAQTVTSLSFSTDGAVLALGDRNGSVRLLKIGMESETNFNVTVKAGTGPVHALAFSTDDLYLAAGSRHTIRIWSITTMDTVATITAPGHWPAALAFSPDAAKIASGSSDTTDDDDRTHIFDIATGECVATLEDSRCPVHSVLFAPDGRQVVSRGLDGRVHVRVIPLPEQPCSISRLIGGGATDHAPARFLWVAGTKAGKRFPDGWLHLVGGAGQARSSRRICWFPVDRRPDPRKPKYVWLGNVVVVGTEMGKLTVLDVSDMVESDL